LCSWEIVEINGNYITTKFSLFPTKIFLVHLVWSTGGKWDSLRDYLVVKEIPFLMLCRVERER
jgi:hypothetical protein